MTADSGGGASAQLRGNPRSRWLFVIPVVIIVPTAVFCIHAARESGEPYVQLVGHYAPDLNPVIEVGAGSNAALRLTESEIDDVEGWLRLGDDSFSYVHASPTSNVSVNAAHATAAETITRAVEVSTGDSIEVVGLGRNSTQTLQLIDGLQITLKTDRGDFEIMLPETEGASVPLGDSSGRANLFITYCDGKPVWTLSSGTCSNAVAFGSYFATWLGRIVDATPPVGAPPWAQGARAIVGPAEKSAYLQLAGGAITRIPTPIEIDLRPSGEPFVIWKRPGASEAYVSRRGPPGATVTHIGYSRWMGIGGRKAQRTRVGSVDGLPYESVLVLGSTAFRVTRDGSHIRLRAVERHDRFHFFPSLSAGRVNFTNRVQRFISAAERRVRVVGVGERGAPPPVEVTTPTIVAPVVWSLPVPSWFVASTAAGAPGTYRTIPLASIELTPDEKEITIEDAHRRVGGGWAMTPAKEEEAVDLAGHILEYHRQVPQFDQLVPPISFAVLALLIVLAITHSISEHTPRPANDLTADFLVLATTVVASLIAAALVGGVSLMSHMAAVDTLIGKTDYYHRQLFYSFVAVSVLAAMLIRDRAPNPLATWRTFFPLSIGVLVACTILLVAWMVVDGILWILITDSVGFSDPILFQTMTFGAALALTVPALVGGFLDRHPIRRLLLIGGALISGVALLIGTRTTIAWVPVVLAVVSGLIVLIGNAAGRYEGDEVPWWVAAVRWVSARYHEPTGWLPTLIAAGVLLAAGILFKSGRGSAGVKPAEFAVWFIATGLTGLLGAEFLPNKAPAKEMSARLRTGLSLLAALYFFCTFLAAYTLRYMIGTVLLVCVPFFVLVAFVLFIRYSADDFTLRRWFRVFAVLLALQLAITLLYTAQGDFGPLLVLTPTVTLVVFCWSLAPDRSDSSRRTRFAAPVLVLTTMGWLVSSGVVVITSPWAARIPWIGHSIARASKRLLTFMEPWFTKEGSWGVTSQWLANGFFGDREPMIANLHSDLAFIAALRTFGTAVGTLGILTLYITIILTVIASAWILVRNSARVPSDEAPPKEKIAALSQRLSSREAAFLAIFAALYLTFEIGIHIGSSFNAVPQTGVTLPWFSSGGSAAVAFAGLFGIVFSRALHTIEEPAS